MQYMNQISRVASALLVVGAGASSQCELEILTPPDGVPDDRFGYDVALDGNTLLVSTNKDDDAAANAGAVTVYIHVDEGLSGFPRDDSWTPIAKLTASDATSGDEFGHAMAIQGGLAVVGASGDSGGSAYVFVRDDNGTPADPFDDAWIEVDKLTPDISTLAFGLSVAVFDGTIAAGTRESERAFVYERDDNGTPGNPFDDAWIQTARVFAADGGAGGPGASFSYGWSVALDADTLLVGARRDDEVMGNTGSVYVYARLDGGTPQDPLDDTWVETSKFIADPPVLGGQFGRDIALHGDTALIGASAADRPDSGLAYVFVRDRAGTPLDPMDDTWRQVDTLAPSDAGEGDEFGQGVSLWGNVAVVGSFKHDVGALHRPGAVYVYVREDMGTVDPYDDQWPEVARLTASDAEQRDWLGINVAVQGNLIAGGAPMTNTPSENVRPGKAVLWALDCDSLALDFETEDDFATPLVNGQAIDGEFGRLVAISGTGNTHGLPPAIFDTDPGGPNDPSQDLDLLVGTGNALILQEQPRQTIPGIFDRPNDDARGGLVNLAFSHPVRMSSIDLVDIDSIPGQGVLVTLTDSAGRSRVYSVPSGFTEDHNVEGPPGFRTLDLCRTSPQAGFLSSTSVTQAAGFEPSSVLGLSIRFQGSAALDNLRFVPAIPRMRRCPPP